MDTGSNPSVLTRNALTKSPSLNETLLASSKAEEGLNENRDQDSPLPGHHLHQWV